VLLVLVPPQPPPLVQHVPLRRQKLVPLKMF
jgi:hypothetical protein